MDYFHLNASRDQIAGLSNLGLAHLGDAVFEVMVRSWLCLHGKASARGLHKATVRYVAAPAQAKAVERILPLLTEEEAEIYRRGRNAKKPTKSKNATVAEYVRSTGFEALLGYLYLTGQDGRIKELFFPEDEA